jgi:hypothetical protein
VDRSGVACLLLALAACAARESSSIQVVPQECRIALPYNAAEIGECTPRSAAAYDFAFCYLHYALASAAAPASDRARGAAGLWEQYERKAVAHAKMSQSLSDAAAFRRNLDLAKRYYESLQKQNPMVTGRSLEYIRGKCDNLLTHHLDVIRGDRRL